MLLFNFFVLTEAAFAGADQPWQDREPQSIETVCKGDQQCLQQYRAAISKQQAQAAAADRRWSEDTGGAVGNLVVAVLMVAGLIGVTTFLFGLGSKKKRDE